MKLKLLSFDDLKIFEDIDVKILSFSEYEKTIYLFEDDINKFIIKSSSDLVKPKVLICNDLYWIGADQKVIIISSDGEILKEINLISNFYTFEQIKRDRIALISELETHIYDSLNLKCFEKIIFEDLLLDYIMHETFIEMILYNNKKFIVRYS
ncbi:hypothetical protein ACOSP6_15520 [Tenacibaculum sp. MEBiC06402]|uniref:hypothetical protein n=1 Tax=unclassified Tenacibaculum TaxID=2635139 RepID=UPI003B9D1177